MTAVCLLKEVKKRELPFSGTEGVFELVTCCAQTVGRVKGLPRRQAASWTPTQSNTSMYHYQRLMS